MIPTICGSPGLCSCIMLKEKTALTSSKKCVYIVSKVLASPYKERVKIEDSRLCLLLFLCVASDCSSRLWFYLSDN